MGYVTQEAKILAHCKEHGSITVRDALMLDINSPRKRISDMRKSGQYDVQTIRETRVNSSGDTVRFNRYFIKAVDTHG